MSFGLLTTGFSAPSLDDIKTELEAELRTAFGDSIDLAPQGPFGQFVGIMAERFFELWQLSQAVYASALPESATGAALDNVCAITGTVREAATKSTVSELATGTNGTVLTAGRVVSVSGTGVRFVTLADATLASATPRATLTVYVVGDIRTNNTKIYICITAGTSSAGSGPLTTAPDITDGSVHWRYLGDGAAYAAVDMEAEETGPKVAASGTLSTIETPVSGWSNAYNLLDAELGTDLETDTVLRTRREEELRAAGNAALEAIRADLLEVADVISVSVFENITDTTDGDGLPPHSVEALVREGDDDEIRAALFATVAAGIATHGTESGTVTDSQGVAHTVKFSRPDEIDIYAILSVSVDADLYPDDGDDQIKALIVEWGDAQKVGKDVVSAALVALAFQVPGVLDVTAYIDIAPGPSGPTTIPIGLRELAVYDTSRLTVTSSPGTP